VDGTSLNSDGHKHVWVSRGISFIAVPVSLLVLAFLFPVLVFLGWLVVLASYIAIVSVCGITNRPGERSEISPKAMVRSLGSIVWGGFLLMLYLMSYLLIFHFRYLSTW